MAGMTCPKCGKPTFFETTFGRECSKCGAKMVVPPNGGKGGQGRKCSNCKKYTVFGNKCTNCGATYSL